MKNPNNNRPLLSSKNPHFQNEATCTTVLVKMSFICMRMKIISIWKAEHLTSFPYRGPGELGNGLLYVFLEKVNTFFFPTGQFQKISIPNHGRLPCFNPPLPSEIPKCVTPPCPQNSTIVNPPCPSEFPFFFKIHFWLSNAYMNKRTWIYASLRLWSSSTRRQALLQRQEKPTASGQAVQTPFKSEFGYKNQHHLW